MSEFNIKLIDCESADYFWANATLANAFTNPSILNAISHKVDWWGCFANGNLVGVWPICHDALGNCSPPGFSYYVGLTLSDKYMNQPHHRRSSKLLKIYHSYATEFEKIYHKYQFSLDTYMYDVRYFLWENHLRLDKPKYIITPRYTAQINNLNELTETDIIMNFRSVRRQNIKNALRQEFVFEINNKFSDNKRIIDLYSNTLAKQNIQVKNETIHQITNFLDKIPRDNILFISGLPKNGKDIVFFSLILHSKKISNLILNLTDMNYKETNVSNLGIYHSIIAAKNLGCSCFDFNGANSPMRADDKHSYGAEPKLFFHIEKCLHDE